MAKQVAKSSERSKVRIFFVEGDFASGDLHELTHALTMAIRPSPSAAGALSARSRAALSIVAPNIGAAEEQEDEEALVSDEAESRPEQESRGAPNTKPRSYRKPVPVNMDMSAGGKSFSEFAAEKGPTAHRSKYLVAASWLHDYAKAETATADHIFTCYKSAGWTFDVSDPTVTFRLLKGEGLGSLKRGSFSINHLGLAEVEKMKPST